jgi:two-component system, OmpR family, response regulator
MVNNIKILLLDDDTQVRFNLKMFFEDEGFYCDSFDSSETALKALNGTRYDVAIVDLRLPGMNGEDFISASYNIAPGMKYIIHTGSTQYRLPERLIAPNIEIADVFHKPVSNMNTFVQKIHQLLDSESL